MDWNDVPETYWAWLAGFVDGDGVIGLYLANGYQRPTLTIAQKDRSVLDRIVSRLGVGSVCRRGFTGSGGEMHSLGFGSAASRLIVGRMLPYLDVKKAVAEAMIRGEYLPRGAGRPKGSRHPLHDELVRRYGAGESPIALSEETRVKAETIRYWARMAGLARTASEAQRLRRERIGAQKAPKALSRSVLSHEGRSAVQKAAGATRRDSAFTRPEAIEAARRYDGGMPISEIARSLNAKPATINYWLRRQGVTRSLSESQRLRRQRERSVVHDTMTTA